MKLSLCLATYNEEKNISDCINSVKDIVDEIVVVDGSSSDKTVEIAKKLGAKVIVTDNPKMFHINKQKAMDVAIGDWILQLDADERVTPELKKEITNIVNPKQQNVIPNSFRDPLYSKQKQILKKFQDDIDAYYIPRMNYFLGKFLKYGGLYPDGVIRLIKKGRAYLSCKDVHELMTVKGKIGWLKNPLLHYDSPTFKRYWERNTRYVNLMANEMEQKRLKKNFINFINFLLYKPISWFILTTIRHKSFLDGWQGIAFSFFSSLRFPRAYLIYLRS